MKNVYVLLAMGVFLTGCISMPESLSTVMGNKNSASETSSNEREKAKAKPVRMANAAPSVMTLFVFSGPSNSIAGKSKSFKEGYSIRFPLYGPDGKKPDTFSNYFEQ